MCSFSIGIGPCRNHRSPHSNNRNEYVILVYNKLENAFVAQLFAQFRWKCL